MSARDLTVDLLVGLGVTAELLCCIALVVMRDVFDRLHYAMAASTLPPLLIAAAVLTEEGWNSAGINAVAVAAFLLLLNPAAGIATARAARIRRAGQIALTADEEGKR